MDLQTYDWKEFKTLNLKINSKIFTTVKKSFSKRILSTNS